MALDDVDFIDDVADAVRDDLQDAVDTSQFNTHFTPERSNGDWDLELVDDDLHVDVVANTTPIRTELETRGSVQYRAQVDIAVRKKVSQSEVDTDTGRAAMVDVRRWRALVFGIHRYFVKRRLDEATIAGAVWDPEEDVAIRTNGSGGGLRGSLKIAKQFTGVIRLTFLVPVDL